MKGGRRGAGEPPVRALSVETYPDAGSAPPPAQHPGPAPWTVWVVAAVGGAALVYGFMLGRGTGSRATATVDLPGTSAPGTDLPATTALPDESLPEELVSFIRAAPDHDLGRGVTEYLAVPKFDTIAVDTGGLVWLGGSTGLVRFDPIAEEFSHLTRPDGTGPLDVREIALGPDESVWVTTGSGLARWEGDVWTTGVRVIPAGSLDREIGPVDIGPDGTIWLVTHRWDLGHSQIHRSPPPFFGDVPTVSLHGEVSDIVATGSGAWAVAESQVWRYTDGWDRVDVDTWWLDRLCVTSDGDVWLAGGHTVLRQEETGFIEVAWAPLGEDPGAADDPFGGEVWIQSLAAGPDGAMWGLVHEFAYGTQDDNTAVVRFDGEAAATHPVPDPGDWPRDLAVGPDGTVWIAAGDALLGFDGTGWSEFRPPQTLPIGWISSVATDRDGIVWMAGETGIVQGTDGPVFGRTELGLPEPDASDQPTPYWVATDPAGAVWGGTGSHAFRFRDGVWDPLPPLLAPPEEWWEVKAEVGVDGTLWLVVGCCDWSSPLYRFSGEAWEVVEHPHARRTGEPWTPPAIVDLAFATDGSVWAAGDWGISRYAAGEWTTIFGGESFASIAAAGDGSMWAAPSRWSDSSGLWHHADGAWNVTASGLTTEALVTGPDGTVWALQSDPGRRTMVRDTGARGVRWIVESDGISEMAIANDGTFWMGGTGRLYRVDPLA